jgi:hypothetical protein
MALATLVKYGIVPKPKGTQSSAVSQTPDQSYSANNTSAKNNKDNPSNE